MTVSPKVVYASAAALLLVLAATVPVMRWFESEVGDTGLHGPVAVVAALPLVLIYAVGGDVRVNLECQAFVFRPHSPSKTNRPS